jgi:phospholipid transport system transporter-binding protein
MPGEALLKVEPRADGVIAITGVLSFETVTAALAASSEFLTAGGKRRFDLAGVTRADSAGLALLVEWLKLAQQCKASVVFENDPAQFRALATASGLEALLFPAAP